jgi:hypothetical protein
MTPRALWFYVLMGCAGKRAEPKARSAGAERTDSGVVEADTAQSETGEPTGDTSETGHPEPSPVGPCDEWGTPEAVGEVADGALREISGVVASQNNPGVLWVIEDSGADPVITALDTAGDTLGSITLDGVSNRDWEDLALGPCDESTCLFVAEIGDNGASHAEVAIYIFPEPTLSDSTDFEWTITPAIYPFSYPEGPQDAEALVVDTDGRPIVITKRTDATARVYRVSASVGVSTPATLLATIPTGESEGLPMMVTGAGLWPDGTRLLLRRYIGAVEYTLGGGFELLATAPRNEIITGIELQGESIAYDLAQRAIWHISEGRNPSVYRIGCMD